MSASVEIRGLDRALGVLTGRLKDMRPATKRCAGLYLQSIGQEFRQERYFGERGSIKWKKTQPFGTRKPPKRTLQRSGALFNAATGRGPGAIVRSAKQSFTVGIRASILPFAEYLRGGTGHLVRLAVRLIKPKKKVRGRRSGPQQFAMWWRIFFDFGVTASMRKMREGFRQFPKPWGGISRQLNDQWRRVIRSYLLTGNAFGRSL